MSRKQLALFEPTLVVQALKEAVKKLNPQAQWRNPVMFIVWIGSLLTTCISIAMASGAMPGNALFSAAISGWLWVTVLFANFAEALAEGRSKAQANSLKGVKKTAFARKLREPKYGAAADKVPADQLRKGDIVLVEAGDIIPCDGEVIEGGASVDESAITGIITPKRPTNMQNASKQFQNGELALNPAKALPLLLAADDTAYSTSLKPCGPGLSMALRPASVIIASAAPISTSVGVTRIASAVSFISRTSIFLPRYSGVRPIISPAINTASRTNSIMP